MTRLLHLKDMCFQGFCPYAFVHIPKTGGTSIRQGFGVPRFSYTSVHLTANEQYRILGEKLWNKKFSFTFVRNPWDRLVSYYHFERQHTFARDLQLISFKVFVKILLQEGNYDFFGKVRGRKFKKYLSNQLDWITDNNGKIIVLYCARHELFSEEMQFIAYQCGKSLPSMPHIIRSVRQKDYRLYYDDDTAEIAAQYYAPDIQHFNYHFDLEN